MRYQITSLVFGTLDLPMNGLKLQYGNTFMIERLNEELMWAKGNRHIRIDMIEEEKKAQHDEEPKKKKKQYEETHAQAQNEEKNGDV